MDTRAKDAFVKRLLEIINNITTLSSASDWHELTGHNYVMVGENIALVDENITRYEKLFEQIWTKLRAEERFARETIDKDLKQLIVRVVKEGNHGNATPYFYEFVENIETYSIEQLIYIALDNIEMRDIDKLKIGRVTIVKMTERRIGAIVKRIKSVVSSMDYSPVERRLVLEDLLKTNVEPLRGKVCTEFRFVAEPETAEERALEETFHVIDLLRFAIPILYPIYYPINWYPPDIREKERVKLKKSNYRTRSRVGVGLQGDVGTGFLNTIMLSSNADEFHLKSRRAGMRAFELSPNTIATMKKIGVFKVANLLKKSEKEVTSFEEVLLRSIHWFANAQVQFELENELLNLVTSLETILAGPTDNLMDAVGFGVAFLLGANLRQRVDLIARYIDIYNKRSSTSHHGHGNADELDLIELRCIAFDIIQKAIKNMNRWKEHKHLLDKIKRKKLM